nr:MAG TPA: hypothetical protein [Caudoviricetes sp.]
MKIIHFGLASFVKGVILIIESLKEVKCMKANLPKCQKRDIPYVIRIDAVRRCYVYEYDLANLFYKALRSFKSAQVNEYDGFYHVVSVVDVENEGEYSRCGSGVQFIPAEEYIQISHARGLLTGLIYNVERNDCNLSEGSLKALRNEYSRLRR